MRKLTPLTTRLFLVLLGLTLGIWILRGLGIFTFLPGGLIWLLLLLTIGAGVINGIQRTRRW
ncbi:MAG: hypothetical protein VKK04_12355 [Synechococcales bacterium]|nr:hypothetical protein [Synechococcales bacterium]